MKEYQSFIGIDIGKFTFVAALYNQQVTAEYKNTDEGISQFITDYKDILSNTLTIVETTGGYELELLYALCSQNHSVHRANTRKVKNFIRSFGNASKTDALDAKALAYYGKERSNSLSLFVPQSKRSIDLFHLVHRRTDLKKILVAEKNRIQGPSSKSSKFIQRSCNQVIKMLVKQIEGITEQIKQAIAEDPVLKEKHKILKTIPGVGELIAAELLILLPELGGKITRRQIASLVGLAPRSNDSGCFHGYRRTGHGRDGIKPMLFLAAMAARNSKSDLKDFYEGLIVRGKRKMVALTALMRKIIVIANAKLKCFRYAEI